MSGDGWVSRPRSVASCEVLAEAVALRAAHLGTGGYGVAYGSHTDGSAGPTSDLDLLLVGTEPLLPERMRTLADDVISLHRRHGLGLDREVSYDSKLHATTGQVDQATWLRGFTLTADGDIAVEPVVAEPWFLESPAFKLRLILNALTVPHVFLGGDVALYEHHRTRAERATALLALALLGDREETTVGDAVAVLRGDPAGPHGEDFLGHTERAGRAPALFSALQRALGALEREGVISTCDGVLIRQYADRRRALLRELVSPAVGG
ncbi:hypothetical protein ACFVVX_10690 [Kitasatospora sp. NPDC058170]|uniref:nucleotidyltransferase domain-containing protein n=1 Tax=Kitasatospora sp. NPDC058170 TaxID=3346364 RepID=UPI0036DBE37B